MLSKNLIYILDKINSFGFEAYLVGGAVRDILLGKEPKDYDIATNAIPEEIQQIFTNSIPRGIKYGTVTVIRDNDFYDITTFRIDGNYSDKRRPEKVYYINSLKEDLKRRDFTINAMALDKYDELYDFFGGQEDLKNKLVRTVGDPSLRFKEDELRKLRGIRFCCQLDFHLHCDTLKAIKFNPHSNSISYERIRDEFDKIILSDNANKGLEMLIQTGMISYIIPEYKEHNYNFSNLFEDIDRAKKNLTTRLALFFLLIKKTENIDNNKILKRLKYSNKIIKDVILLCKYDSIESGIHFKSIINDLGELMPIFLELFKIINKNNLEEINQLVKEYEYIIDNLIPVSRKDLAINGKDLLILGYSGEEIGVIIEYVLEEVRKTPNINKKNKLLDLVQDYKRRS
ncbi:MAG: CCA tRNA nucleotidyltransferase [Eubacteriaceae bacterium]